MAETLRLGEVVIAVTRKNVKHVHLSVHPPDGRVTLVTPTNTSLELAHAYAASKIRWIREQQGKLLAQRREAPRQFIERESHYVWGRRYLMSVIELEGKPGRVARPPPRSSFPFGPAAARGNAQRSFTSGTRLCSTRRCHP